MEDREIENKKKTVTEDEADKHANGGERRDRGSKRRDNQTKRSESPIGATHGNFPKIMTERPIGATPGSSSTGAAQEGMERGGGGKIMRCRNGDERI